MLLAAVALLAHRPHPTEAEVREALAGNLCRCTGYVKIVAAVLAASRAGQQAGAPARDRGAISDVSRAPAGPGR
jgi:xanthine dehydrogenase iron-sulfur cluster and FAD-binding subunit A